MDAHGHETAGPKPLGLAQEGPLSGHPHSVLCVDLAALTANWRLLASRVHPACECAAVIKADAYGLGALPVGRALEAAGCPAFFVAHVDEGVALRAVLAPHRPIRVLHGPLPGTEALFGFSNLTPVLNSLAQIKAWVAYTQTQPSSPPVWLQIDTGMARMGLAPDEWAAFLASPALYGALRVEGLMSHLACADEPEHPINAQQHDAFKAALTAFPNAQASLANSSGVFLGPQYHFDSVRPGAALYGINPTPAHPNPMRPVAFVSARVVQIRDLSPGTGVGYGHTWTARQPTRLATVSVGYADGFFRALSTVAALFAGEHALPIVGRVSMDSLMLDLSALPSPDALKVGDFVEVMGTHNTADTLAKQAGTIGYEVLTRLSGSRHRRSYHHGPSLRPE